MTSNPLPIILGLLALAAFYLFNFLRSKQKKKQLEEAIENNAKIIDVRSAAEYKSGHYPGSINIPVDTISKKMKSLGNKEDAIILYCASGARSASATAQLKASGFSNVINAKTQANLP